MRKTCLLLTLGMACLWAIPTLVLAQAPLPGDTTLPTPQTKLDQLAAYENGAYDLSVEDFLRTPTLSNFGLSASGQYISYFFKDSLFVVKDTRKGTSQQLTDVPLQPYTHYFWLDDARVVFVADADGNEVYHLFALTIATGQVANLTPYEGVSVQLLNELAHDPQHLIVAMNKDNPELFEPYRLNVATGEALRLFENKLEEGFITDYYFSDAGELRAYYTQENGDYVLYYKTQAGHFERVLSLGFGELFIPLQFVAHDTNPNLVYATANLTTDKRHIVLYDLARKEVVETLFTHNTYDIDEIGTVVSQNTIDYYAYQGVTPTIVPVSNAYKAIHKRIMAQIAGQAYEISRVTTQQDKLLIKTESDRIAGRYYLYNTTNDSLTLLADMKPQLPPALLCPKTPFTFYTRDSLRLEGYYYKPLTANSTHKAPLLVIPHGGPFDIRNEWGFANYAQLFANRGYCVLEINFRGSYGYGKAFQQLGFNQIGQAMLNDLEDGVRFMQQKPWIKENRVAIYGPSYGGLAALQSLIQQDHLYTCAIDYCGPSNLFTLFESFPPSWKEFIAFFHHTWYDPNIEAEAALMRQVSPFFHLQQINKPLLVIHGANDTRVTINESDQLVRALRARGLEVPYLVRYDEGHGFIKEENNIALNKVVLGFLAKHLKE